MKKSSQTKHILVTGFPTFTTVRLVKRIVEVDKRAKLYILVMEKHQKTAVKLLQKLSNTEKKQVTLVNGDVTFLDLGLSGDEFNNLTRKITHIYHLAAIWEYGVPKTICKEVNILGTQNILNLARESSNLKQFIFFSTIYISGTRKGVIREDEFDLKQGFKNPLESTRFIAEKLVRKSSESGLPTTIFRLGTVVGDSKTGEIMKFEGPYLLLKLLLTTDSNLPLILPGQCEGPSNLVPVDYVVAACQHISYRESSIGQTYHITDPYPLMTRTVFEAVCSYMGRRSPIFGLPRRLYKAIFLVPQMERFAGVPKELFDYFNHKAVHNCSNALSALQGTEIICPRFESYFPLAIEESRKMLKKRIDRMEEAETIDPLDMQIP